MGKVKIKPANTIKTRLGVEPNGKAHKLFTQRCYDHMRKYVPGGEKGDLAKNVAVTSSYIVFMSPYAHYQYTGKLYVDPDYNIGAFYSPKYGFWSRRDVKKIKYHRKCGTPSALPRDSRTKATENGYGVAATGRSC